MTLEYLAPFEGYPSTFSRVLPLRIWYYALTEKSLFPWLWDLDLETVGAYSPDNWDWELLIRQLSGSTAFEPGNDMESVPPGLVNRKRIWRLVNEARMGDCYVGLPEDGDEYCPGPPCRINHPREPYERPT